MTNYLENSRWMWAYIAKCETCDWYSTSQDYSFTSQARYVHADLLFPGHFVNPIEKVERE